MQSLIYTFSFSPNWMQLTKEISQIDRFDASWTTIEKREGQTLKQLKSIATVRSVGSSTRIEGSRMTDDEVEILIKNLSISKLEERDQQEVAGYFETLELIAGSFKDIEITENNLKHLHNVLLKYSEKDAWHRGNYKQHSNMVEAKNGDGTREVIFHTTEPGFATADAMRNLVEWYTTDMQTHTLIKAAVFVYDFLSIHPFQDGNGRLSRLLGTLLLLKSGYSWIQYVSFEHEIESRKAEYYRILMQCQRQRPGEEINAWVLFFLDCLKNIQQQLLAKLEVHARSDNLSHREKKIYSFIGNHPGSQSGDIAKKLDIPLPSVKRILSELVKSKLLAINGAGAGTSYTIEGGATIEKDLAMRFTNAERKKQFLLKNPGSFIEIKKLILTPLFEWTHPDEWGTRLAKTGLYFQITCSTNKGSVTTSAPYPIAASPYHYQPVFPLNQPIHIPANVLKGNSYKSDFPMQVIIEISGSTPVIEFDIMIIYDEK
jgi:Fic family protein